MINNFDTDNKAKADAATIVYAVYRSRNRDKGPKGLDMWGQIERFIRVSAKRSNSVGAFLDKFKKKMACDTINPRYTKTDSNSTYAKVDENGSIVVADNDKRRNFMIDILESEEAHQKEIIKMLYKETQLIVLLVRSRLETEKQYNDEGEDNE